jgi:acetylornithine/succinyldiaminopimelate/putrescine aminotransferase
MGALSATGQPAKRAAFEPLVPGVTFAQLNDAASLEAAVGPDTGLILIEPVQGEGGVNPATPGFLAAAAELAAEHGALLCFDEVQTGVGRTGTFFAFEQLGVRPHLVTLAKGLANGLPIGALLATDDAPAGLVPGDHASTFGGNPVVCAAACAVVETVDEALLQNVRDRSDQLAEALPVRGAGLLLGLEAGPDAVARCFDAGLLVTSAGPTTLRLSPPLTVSPDEVAQAISILQEVLQ